MLQYALLCFTAFFNHCTVKEKTMKYITVFNAKPTTSTRWLVVVENQKHFFAGEFDYEQFIFSQYLKNVYADIRVYARDESIGKDVVYRLVKRFDSVKAFYVSLFDTPSEDLPF